MRDIKFRAWNEVLEKMYSWNEFLNTNMKQTFIAPESTAMILMQYTGLKDKNGKEIYEGDIVKAKFFEKHITGKIEFALGAFFVTGSEVSDNQMFIFNDFEVIGNIYNNPELLKGEQS